MTPSHAADGLLAHSALPELTRAAGESGDPLQLGDLSDLMLLLEASLGSVELDLASLLELQVGSVVPLDLRTGEALEVTVNGTPVARGEVRVHGERFAVRITEIPMAVPLDATEEVPRDAAKAPSP